MKNSGTHYLFLYMALGAILCLYIISTKMEFDNDAEKITLFVTIFNGILIILNIFSGIIIIKQTNVIQTTFWEYYSAIEKSLNMILMDLISGDLSVDVDDAIIARTIDSDKKIASFLESEIEKNELKKPIAKNYVSLYEELICHVEKTQFPIAFRKSLIEHSYHSRIYNLIRKKL